MQPNTTEQVIMIYRMGEFIPSLIMRIDDYTLSDEEFILRYEGTEQKITFEWSYFSVCHLHDLFEIDQLRSQWNFKSQHRRTHERI